MIQISFVERASIKWCWKKPFSEEEDSLLHLYLGRSWRAAWNDSVRCSDSTSKYRCGQGEPPLTFNYLKWTKQTGKRWSQQVKINKAGAVTTSTLRAEFLSCSFFQPFVVVPGLWARKLTQRPRNAGPARAESVSLPAAGLGKSCQSSGDGG